MGSRVMQSGVVTSAESDQSADSGRTAPGKFTKSEKKWVETVLQAYKDGRKELKDCMTALENFIIEAESRAVNIAIDDVLEQTQHRESLMFKTPWRGKGKVSDGDK